METLKSFEEVGVITDATNTDPVAQRLIQKRAEVIDCVESFTDIAGVGEPVYRILDTFGDYLLMCGYLEGIAQEYENKGYLKSDKEAEEKAERIRSECLPNFSWVATQFMCVKEIVSLIVRASEAIEESKHLKAILAERQSENT